MRSVQGQCGCRRREQAMCQVIQNKKIRKRGEADLPVIEKTLDSRHESGRDEKRRHGG